MYFNKICKKDWDNDYYYRKDEEINNLIKCYQDLLSEFSMRIDEEEDTDNSDEYEAIAKAPIRVIIKAEPRYNKKNEKNFEPLYFPEIKNVFFRNPATIVFFEDGSKTTAICGSDDKYDKEVGLTICMLKRALGNQKYRKIMDKWCYNKEQLN